jgi:hypothetical protein
MPFRVATPLRQEIHFAELGECQDYICAHPEQFPRGRLVRVHGTDAADAINADHTYWFTPPFTPSETFREELLAVMGPERGRVTAVAEERELVPGQISAVRFERGVSPPWICIVRRGPSVRDIGFVTDINPHGFMPGKFLRLEAVARFVLEQLLGTTP